MLRVDVEEEGCVLLVSDTTCLLGPCKNTPWKSLKSSNDLQWPEPRIHCCPQPPTMILSACRISSMYSSSAEATYEPACIQRKKLHTEKNGITHQTKLFIRNFVRNGRNTNWRGTAKPSSWIFRNNLPEMCWNTLSVLGELRKEGRCVESQFHHNRSLQRACLNQTCLIPEIYSFWEAAEGRKLKGKNQIHHNAPGQSW